MSTIFRRLRAPIALAALIALALPGCGGGSAGIPWGPGTMEIENHELSTTFMDVMTLDLEEVDWSDPWADEGWDWAESFHNRDPNEMETFDDLRPGWWRVEILWGDGTVTVDHDVHVYGGEVTNFEIQN